MSGLIKNLISKLAGQKGFTVLESILTTSVLSVGLMGGLLVMQNSVLASVKGDRTTLAMQFAQEKAEEVMADSKFRGYDFAADESNYTLDDLDDANEGFVRTVAITEVDPIDLTTPAVGSGMSKVAVDVSWGTEANQHVGYSTLITDYQ